LYLIKQRPHLERVSYFFLSERLSHDHAAGRPPRQKRTAFFISFESIPTIPASRGSPS
jgi:hypothetical protein